MIHNKFSPRLAGGLVILLVLGVLLAGFPTSVYAQQTQPTGWSQPQDLGSGWFPAIAADETGRVHVVWSWNKQLGFPPQVTPEPGQLPPGYDQVLYSYTDDGSHWSPVNDIIARQQNGGSEVTRPSILVDSQGIMHMTFRDTRVYYSQAPVQQADSAQSWSDLYPFSTNLVSYYSSLGMDSKGRLQVVYTENVITSFCLSCFHLYYRSSDDQGVTWSDPVDISVLPTGAAKPQLLIDPRNDNLYVVWEAGSGGSYGQLTDPTTVMFAASYDRGAHWTKPHEFFIPNMIGKNIAIGRSGNGDLLVAWLSEPQDLIVYQISKDQGHTWSDPKPVSGVFGEYKVYPSRLDDFSMATDSAGHIHLVLVGRTSANQASLDVLHLVWNDLQWSKPDVIATLSGNVPEWPRIAISNGNQLNVVWFVRDQAHIWVSDHGNYHVYYSRKTGDSASLAPTTWPTPTPGITITPTPVPPTPTPTPVNPIIRETPVDPNLTKSVFADTDETLLMAKALIPSALVLLIVVGFIRFKKH